jgi:LysR family glycine cleavage system transcriptional activator
MRRVLPPLNPLRTFEVAARHVSFTHAAEELGVTQTAVSRQVAVLEAFLKVKLFERHNSELTLTEYGHAYHNAIQPALDLIAHATAGTRGLVPNQLNLRVYVTFAMRWLMPRLQSFRAKHPNIGINMSTSISPADFEREDLDINICHGDGKWPGVKSWLLFPDRIAPVCAPSLLGGARPPAVPADLRGQPLLHSRHRRADWSEWLDSVGVTLPPSQQDLVFETSMLVYEAAKQGMGFAIGQLPLLKAELDSGQLVAPFPPLERPLGYYLLHRSQGRLEPKIEAFKAWLLAEAAADTGPSPQAPSQQAPLQSMRRSPAAA